MNDILPTNSGLHITWAPSVWFHPVQMWHLQYGQTDMMKSALTKIRSNWLSVQITQNEQTNVAVTN
jgi:hypothetical protein